MLRMILGQCGVDGSNSIIADVLDLEQIENWFGEVVILAGREQSSYCPFRAKLGCSLCETTAISGWRDA